MWQLLSLKNMLRRHIQLHNCTIKFLYIFMVEKFSFGFEEDTKLRMEKKKVVDRKEGFSEPFPVLRDLFHLPFLQGCV